MNRFLISLSAVALAVAATGTVFGQYRTSASRLRDLESRMQEMISLNEAFLPTIQRMNDRLEALDAQVTGLASSSQRYEAQIDVAELQQRLGRLEQWFESTWKRQTWGPEEVTWLRSEYDVLAARLDGMEGRIDQLTKRSAYYPTAYPSQSRQPENGTHAFRPQYPSTSWQEVAVPVSETFDDFAAPASAFVFDDQATIRLIIEIRVITDRDGNITSYRMPGKAWLRCTSTARH